MNYTDKQLADSLRICCDISCRGCILHHKEGMNCTTLLKQAAADRIEELSHVAPAPASIPTTRAEILDAAKAIVCNDRESQYGKPEDNFALIGDLWGALLLVEPIKPQMVAAMMVALKLARISTGAGKADNWVDAAGYAACGGEIDANSRSV